MAGDALRDLLIGKSNPSGKLPITYPKFDDGGGIPYLHAVSDLCTKDTGGTLPHWENTQCEVQWPFGHGKSYTKFEYSGLSISSQHLNYLRSSESISLNVTLTVKNTGILAGSDTILFFTFDENRATTPEYKRLRGFEKVWLEPGTSIQLQLSLPLDDFRFVGPHDATHYTLQDGMTFRFGISAHIDCRENPDDDLCSAPITMHTDPSYVGACEAACNLWENSGCTGSYGMTSESCWDMCTSIQRSEDVVSNNDGW
jgi:beta-glucosidase